MRFQGAKNCLAEGQDLNYLVTSMIQEVLKQNNHEKSTYTIDSGSEEDPDNINFENLSIG